MSKPIPKLNKSNKKFDTNELGINDEIEFFKKENEYLKIELAYLKKAKSAGLKRPTRKQQTKIVYELTNEGFELQTILKLTELPESTYYYHLSKKDQAKKDKELERLILETLKKSKETYGYRRIQEKLNKMGLQINHKRILRLTKKLGIQCTKYSRKSRRYNSYKGNSR